MLAMGRCGIRVLIYFHHVISFLVWLQAKLIEECPWFFGHCRDQPGHALLEIVYLSRENLAGNHQGDGTRLEAMLWSSSGCLRAGRERHEDQSTQRDQQSPHHPISSTKVKPSCKRRVEEASRRERGKQTAWREI